MVTAITAIKKKFENSITQSHAVAAVPEASHRGCSITQEGHVVAVLSEASHSETSHWRYSITQGHKIAVVPKALHWGYVVTRGHAETEIGGLSLEGDLYAFCCTRDEKVTEKRFAELVTKWRSETGGLSSPRAIASHWAYQQIIQMGQLGEPVLPMIFQELEENGGWWYPALRALTKQNPVPQEAKGRPPLNKAAWLDWGRRNGYLPHI